MEFKNHIEAVQEIDYLNWSKRENNKHVKRQMNMIVNFVLLISSQFTGMIFTAKEPTVCYFCKHT